MNDEAVLGWLRRTVRTPEEGMRIYMLMLLARISSGSPPPGVGEDSRPAVVDERLVAHLRRSLENYGQGDGA